MFWPQDIQLSDTQSPLEILAAAQEEWRISRDGVMELVLQRTISKSGNFVIIAHAKHVLSDRTATLFSVVYRPGYPYPVTIQPEEEDLPTFLKKSYYELAKSPLVEMKETIALIPTLDEPGKRFLNQWVSDTPPEFRKKLAEVFNLGIVKSVILHLASSTSENMNSTIEDLREDWVKN